MIKWHYIDGPRRVGPFNDSEWAELVRTGVVGPDTLVWNENLSGWVAFRTLPPPLEPMIEVQEEEDDLLMEETGHFQENPEAFIARTLEQDYSVPFRASFSRGFHLFKENFWLLASSTLLTWVLISIGNGLPSLLALIMPLALKSVLEGGLYSIYLRLMRREPATPFDLFSGFDSDIFRHLVMRTLYGAMIAYASLSAATAALFFAGFKATSEGETNPEVITDPEVIADPQVILERLNVFFAGLDFASWMAILLALFVCALPFLYFKICWMFATPLIWDKRISTSQALYLSRKKVLQHPWQITGLIIVTGFLAVLPGFATLLVYSFFSRFLSAGVETTSVVALAFMAIVVAGPFYIGTLLSLYERVFNEKPAEASSLAERGTRETAAQPE